MKAPSFDELLESRAHDAWIREEGLSIYVRKSRVYKGLIELANINAKKPGNGDFTRFLGRIEHLPLLVENVITDQFADYFRRRQWVEIPCPYGVPSFLNKEAVEQGLGPLRKALLPSRTAS